MRQKRSLTDNAETWPRSLGMGRRSQVREKDVKDDGDNNRKLLLLWVVRIGSSKIRYVVGEKF